MDQNGGWKRQLSADDVSGDGKRYRQTGLVGDAHADESLPYPPGPFPHFASGPEKPELGFPLPFSMYTLPSQSASALSGFSLERANDVFNGNSTPEVFMNDNAMAVIDHLHSVAPDEEEICYGMLHDVDVQLRWFPKDLERDNPNLETLGSGQSFVRMKISLEDEYGVVQTNHGEIFAILNKHTFSALSRLSPASALRFQGLILDHEWKSKVETKRKLRPKDPKTVCMKTDIVLLGPRYASEGLAKDLASFQLYLQDPYEGAISCSYENPQSLELPELPTIRDSLLNATAHEFEHMEEVTEETQGAEASSLLANIDKFFDDLPAHDYLAKAHTDVRVMTSLLSHQREGVDFIARRENAGSLPERSLWQHHSPIHNETYYQHVITGAKSRSPEDTLGGILADDMGLGKTLTMLAAVVGSMGAARDFALRRSGKLPLGGEPTSFAKSTIVIVPSELLLDTWAREIDKHISYGTIRFTKYHGQDRHENEAALLKYDIILTTYGTVTAEFRRRIGILYRIHWHRLVLDEAHTIRNWSSKQFQAVTNISSHIRWCLTGTPIQNSLDDLGALVRFLRVPILDDTPTFRKHISKDGSHSRTSCSEFENLRLLLGSICLRRNKSVLPSMGYTLEDCRPEFTAQERQQYRALEVMCNRAIEVATNSHSSKTTHHRVMEALLRLRIFCNNGTIESDLSALGLPLEPDEVLSVLQQSGEAVCVYCSCDILSISGSRLTKSDSAYLTRCCRLVCCECTTQYRNEYHDPGTSGCPLCHEEHGMDDMPVNNLNETLAATSSHIRFPSKVMALLQDVQTHYLRDKCIIFSFWKKSLDVVGNALRTNQISYLRIDGDLPSRKRNDILLEFQSRSAARVLLMTFSTGAVGLNGLTVASRIHVLEPQWNPAVENQAIGRVLRIDQGRKVTVRRYAIKKSIEEVVQSRQLHKLQLACGGFTTERDPRQNKAQQFQQLRACLQ